MKEVPARALSYHASYVHTRGLLRGICCVLFLIFCIISFRSRLCYPSGTRCGHFSETMFENELMTGFVNAVRVIGVCFLVEKRGSQAPRQHLEADAASSTRMQSSGQYKY